MIHRRQRNGLTQLWRAVARERDGVLFAQRGNLRVAFWCWKFASGKRNGVCLTEFRGCFAPVFCGAEIEWGHRCVIHAGKRNGAFVMQRGRWFKFGLRQACGGGRRERNRHGTRGRAPRKLGCITGWRNRRRGTRNGRRWQGNSRFVFIERWRHSCGTGSGQRHEGGTCRCGGGIVRFDRKDRLTNRTFDSRSARRNFFLIDFQHGLTALA